MLKGKRALARRSWSEAHCLPVSI